MTIYLPLYSPSRNDVCKKSGLNQWHACGRPRSYDEVYIPIPSKIHKTYPNFFPSRDIHFALILPNSKILICKVCQDNSKALMSTPNSDLGEWLLRDVLEIHPGTLVKYNTLVNKNINSVSIERIYDESCINKLSLQLINIFKNQNHNIFKIQGNQSFSLDQINSIFYRILKFKLFYKINVAPWNAYENQFSI